MRFDAADLRRWPINQSDLALFYDRATEEMGLCGTGDRPPLKPASAIAHLLTAVESVDVDDLRLDPFVPTLALRTQPGDSTSCIYCGACMSGCPRQSVYCASSTIRRMITEGVVSQAITAQVLAIDLENRTLTILSKDGRHEQVGPYDLILVAAGCLGTGQILLRSLPSLEHVDMLDNPVFTFPILVTGRLAQTSSEAGYFGLTNGCINVVPTDPTVPAASVQLYPAMDHLWRYFVTGRLWSTLDPFGQMLRRRLVIGRLYLHSDYGSLIRMALSTSSAPNLSLLRRGALPSSLWSSLRQALSCQGFWVPQRPILRQKTSSHYAGTLPFGTAGLDGEGQLRPGVYLCDSTVFQDSPAGSPTLTIMANAMRTAQAARPV
ncbi:MAG: hypothetical protein HYU59_08785 [Magnetospirillum gryphiswaldense]|nr:hypothetical protein [Magnetospirillum gryphiswaldense]